MMRQRRSLPILLLAVALAAACDSGPAAITGPAAPAARPNYGPSLPVGPRILHLETFVATEVHVRGTCSLLGTGTFTVEAAGEAQGPYPGTFFEVGELQVLGDGTASFTSRFGINSQTQIEGRKATSAPITGSCSGTTVTLAGPVQYAATVEGFEDRGVASVELSWDGSTGRKIFSETFFSQFPPQPVVNVGI